MRNPHQWRNIGLAAAASGIAAMAAVVLLPESAMGLNAQVGLACYAVTAIIFGALWSIYRHGEARAKDALLRGDGLIGRWRVDGATWREFIALNQTFSINELPLRKAAAEEGIEVLCGKSAVMVDGYVCAWGKQTQVVQAVLGASVPPCVYLTLRIANPRGPPVTTSLVFPAPVHAHGQAHRVVAHYSDVAPAERALRDARQQRVLVPAIVGLLFAIGLLLAVGMGLLLFYLLPTLLSPGVSVGGTRFSGTPTQAWWVIGLLGAVGALGLAFMWVALRKFKALFNQALPVRE